MPTKNLLMCFPDHHDKLQSIASQIHPSSCTCFYGFLFKFVNCLLHLNLLGILNKVTTISFVTLAKYFYLEYQAEYSNCELACLRINCEICYTYLHPSFNELCKSIEIQSDFIVKKVHRQLHSFLIQQFSKCNHH